MRHRLFRPLLLLAAAAVILLCVPTRTGSPACAEEAFSVSLPETVKGYTPCEITVVSPAAGQVTLSLYDLLRNPWYRIEATVRPGENRIPWDGLGYYGERMMAGPYQFIAILEGEDGRQERATADFEINGTTPTLVYALPSSDTLYLDRSERWFAECYVSSRCLVVMEVLDSAGEVAFSKEMTLSDPEGTPVRWAGSVTEKQKIAPGQYTVRMWSKLNPDYRAEFPLTVAEKKTAVPEVGVTGPIIPERGMTDEEIWAIMRKPSVVIAGNGTFRRFDLYREPNRDSRAVGSLRCATQALEVLETEGKWARVRAWNHADGQEVTGYLPLKMLTVCEPSGHYGVLIDKREQTLTVYEDGRPVGTVPVSTGLVVERNHYRETPAGAFLTDVHIGASFAQDGYRYEYPLKYDAGNMIHGAGYVRTGRVRDYSETLPLLGQKASHGCTRVSPFVTGDNPINMYWLWIHLPYHTRVIVLDD